MATSQHLLLSPAELAYLHSALRLTPPIRQDGRVASQFRPLFAETGILPGTNGSARVCFADGTEAIVGVKAEVEKTRPPHYYNSSSNNNNNNNDDDGGRQRRKKQKQKKTTTRATRKIRVTAGREEGEEEDSQAEEASEGGGAEAEAEAEENPDAGDNDWVEMTVEIPGYRDDDSSTVFLATMLSEALLADGEFTKKLWINRRFHWKLYLDIILISPPLSYPLPLLSLTTHLALLSTRLPRLKSEADEDPMFDDDWAASTFIYPRQQPRNSKTTTTATSPPAVSRPPITLLVISVGDNIIFDPSKEELAVADAALAVSVGEAGAAPAPSRDGGAGDVMDVDVDADADADAGGRRNLRLLSVRTIDPPSRLTAPGVPDAVHAAAWGHGAPAKDPGARAAEAGDVAGVWKPTRGGAKIGVLGAMVQKVLERGGVADEVLEALEGVELG